MSETVNCEGLEYTAEIVSAGLADQYLSRSEGVNCKTYVTEADLDNPEAFVGVPKSFMVSNNVVLDAFVRTALKP